MPASLKDVAARAGVSIKTVSNVVNGYEFVSDSTRVKVNAALVELDYRPNLSARSLRTGRTHVISLAVPVLDEPYFGEIASLIVKAAEKRGYTVLIDQTSGDLERERQVAEGIRANMIDGAIASPLAMTEHDVADLARHRPLVLLGERLVSSAADHVAVDSVRAADDAVTHLIGLGRRRIAFVGAEVSVGTGALRLQGYRNALTRAGRKVDNRLVIRAYPFRRAVGAAAAETLLSRKSPPDAIFCVNDMLAMGAIRTIIEHGLRVPDDIAVMGFDDIEDGRFSTPTLSTVWPDKQEIAELAVGLLHERIIRGDSPPAARDVVATHRLELRESTLGTG